MKDFLDGQRRLDAIREGVANPLWSETTTETVVENYGVPRLVVVPPAGPGGLSSGQRAALYFVVFALTVAVAMWATTLPAFGAFLMGLGWMLVLLEISGWVESLEQPASPPTEVLDEPSDPFAGTSPRTRESYSLNHDVRDLATLPCRYGCKEPVTCPWPHADCRHCADARRKAAVDG